MIFWLEYFECIWYLILYAFDSSYLRLSCQVSKQWAHQYPASFCFFVPSWPLTEFIFQIISQNIWWIPSFQAVRHIVHFFDSSRHDGNLLLCFVEQIFEVSLLESHCFFEIGIIMFSVFVERTISTYCITTCSAVILQDLREESHCFFLCKE